MFTNHPPILMQAQQRYALTHACGQTAASTVHLVSCRATRQLTPWDSSCLMSPRSLEAAHAQHTASSVMRNGMKQAWYIELASHGLETVIVCVEGASTTNDKATTP